MQRSTIINPQKYPDLHASAEIRFLQLDKKVKHTKNTRQDFDITAAATGLGGTVATAANNMTTGEILPSVGVAMVPVKETAAPPLTAEQNQATLVRAAVKRLDYMMHDNALVGEKDPDVTKKTAALKAELKQTQIQLIDVPLEETSGHDRRTTERLL